MLMQHKSINESLCKILAENIKTIVNKSDFTNVDIAKHIGVTDRQLRRYKEGLSEPPATVLYELCNFLKVPVQVMFIKKVEYKLHYEHLLSKSSDEVFSVKSIEEFDGGIKVTAERRKT